MKHILITTIVAVLLVGCRLIQSQKLSNVINIKPRLVQPLKFDGLEVSNLDQIEDINSLFYKKISMGDQDGFVFLRSDPDDGESYVLTETAAQYLVRRRRGADSYTTYDIAMESWFLEVVPTLVFMRASKASKFSLLSDDLMDLSVSFLDWVGSEQRASLESDTAKGMSLRDYLNKGKIKSLKKLKNGISFEFDGNKIFISEFDDYLLPEQSIWGGDSIDIDGSIVYPDSIEKKRQYLLTSLATDCMGHYASYYEFNIFIGAYLKYTKTHLPGMYYDILNNNQFRYAYKMIDDNQENNNFETADFYCTESEWHDPVLNKTPALWDDIDLPFLNKTIQMRTVSGCSFSCAFCSYPSTAKGLHTTELELVEKHLQKILNINKVKTMALS